MAATQTTRREVTTADVVSPKQLTERPSDKYFSQRTEYKNSSKAILSERTGAGRTEVPHAPSNDRIILDGESLRSSNIGAAGGSLLREGEKFVDAVVKEVNESSVELECLVKGRYLLVSFPISVVPSDLVRYGQPIRLSMDWTHGYRAPLFERRTPRATAPLDGEDEIDKWITTF